MTNREMRLKTNKEIKLKALKQIEEKIEVNDYVIFINDLDFTSFDRSVSVSRLKSPKHGWADGWKNEKYGSAKDWEVNGLMYPTMKKNNQIEKTDHRGTIYYENVKTYSFENMTKEEILKELEVK